MKWPLRTRKNYVNIWQYFPPQYWAIYFNRDIIYSPVCRGHKRILSIFLFNLVNLLSFYVVWKLDIQTSLRSLLLTPAEVRRVVGWEGGKAWEYNNSISHVANVILFSFHPLYHDFFLSVLARTLHMKFYHGRYEKIIHSTHDV